MLKQYVVPVERASSKNLRHHMTNLLFEWFIIVIMKKILLYFHQNKPLDYRRKPFYIIGLFFTPWKHQKTRGFLIFSGCIEKHQWHETGKYEQYFQ